MIQLLAHLKHHTACERLQDSASQTQSWIAKRREKSGFEQSIQILYLIQVGIKHQQTLLLNQFLHKARASSSTYFILHKIVTTFIHTQTLFLSTLQTEAFIFLAWLTPPSKFPNFTFENNCQVKIYLRLIFLIEKTDWNNA